MPTAQTNSNARKAAPKRAAKAPAKRAAPKSVKIDAIALLKADHREVEAMFEQFEKSRSESKKLDLATKICIALRVHTQIEEEIFYPSSRGKRQVEDDLLDEAYVEHDGAKKLIAEIETMQPSEQFYDAKVKVLSEMIKHHVKEEEQRDGLFAQAKKAGLDMAQLGAELKARKDELMAGYGKKH
jgi:hemerythrin superfamily protein